ncbi:MAG: XRE family transcriptional regulator [Motiliproteus sp.]|nr:XRE family transcriptional regulator [Motiliproteus sp.]MCW9052885.1 XRE family transcriptional regulator [Motiliproteus sp.]
MLETQKTSTESNVAPMQLGKRVREIRLANHLTLEEASRRTGLARSTLSKIENEQISPTFTAVQKLATGLNIDIPQLFVSAKESQTSGRRDITRANEGRPHPTPTYEHQILATQLSNKKMLPYMTTVRARDFSEFPNWVRHEGEEFMLVLKGSVMLHTEFYEPVELKEGDSTYYDGGMGHALVSTSEEDAQVLWITST